MAAKTNKITPAGQAESGLPYYLLGAIGGVALAALAWRITRARPTLFTILLENHSASQVDGENEMPFLSNMAARYAVASDYRTHLSPSLPNYLELTSGQSWGVRDDGYHLIRGRDNLFAQMDASGVPWRAYAESMGRPCRTGSGGLYASRHNPAVYYESVVGDAAACASKVVDLDRLWADLDTADLRYVWITPNLISDAHDGSLAQCDAWLARVVPRIMSSPGYRAGGSIFILFDEGGGGADSSRLQAVVISDRLRSAPLVDSTPYTHRSYLAAVQDLLGLPRLASTAGVASMSSMFR